MKNKFSQSVNIIRDEHYDLKYHVTPNANLVANQIINLFEKGFHSFNIIGSYGTGKSSFLWAFERTLKRKSTYFNIGPLKTNQVHIINIIGEYESIKSIFGIKLGIGNNNTISDVLVELSSLLSREGLTVLVIDEFGKLLEYAVKNKSGEEIYFLQQVAELFNNPESNGLLITTLHQSFEAYGQSLTDAERNEWVKVKGRFKDLTFNEPVEQLLFLASSHKKESLDNGFGIARSNQVLQLNVKYYATNLSKEFGEKISNQLWPLDIISAYLMCVALQRYGQNERSLFTFLESEIENHRDYLNLKLGIPEIYDYLFHEFYSYLNSKYNLDYTVWSMIQLAFDRIDSDFSGDKNIAEDVIKIIGMITLFGHRGAHIEEDFLIEYLSYLYKSNSVSSAIKELLRIKIIRYNRFSKSYKITEGTDLNIENELLQVSSEIEVKLDIVKKLKEYFNFSVINAKSVSYKTGTPRFFQYYISENPINELPSKEYQIDGIINLVFDRKLDVESLKKISKNNDEIIYASFHNIEMIRESIYEIEKTNQVIRKHSDDKVARKELQSIIGSLRAILNHQVTDSLFTNDVEWYYLGNKIQITSKKALYKKISEICNMVYYNTPYYKNELINRHYLSGNISNAKKILFESLIHNNHKDDLGFSKYRYPAEKTIYLTLLKNTGIHCKKGNTYTLGKPKEISFINLWEYSEEFLESAKKEKRSVQSFYEYFKIKPFKLTSGFLDFWIPIYLYIKRDDFALFRKEDGYLPEINETILYLLTRNPEKYELKSFNVKGVKLDLFNKYRELIQLEESEKVSNRSLIESIKPFVIFYRDLNQYTLNTKRLSREAIKVRDTIQTTQDPEKLFFEEFPRGLNTSLESITKSDKALEDYVNKLRKSIKELRICFEELINRIESFILDEIIQQENLSFDGYKILISKRYETLKEHMLLPHQKSLIIRLRSPLDDRSSWLNSICQVLVGKSLDKLSDKEEDILKDRLKQSFNELDNLVSISNDHENELDSEVYKLQLTSFLKGLQEETILVPKLESEKYQSKLDELSKSLTKNKKANIYLLMTLLQKQLNDKN